MSKNEDRYLCVMELWYGCDDYGSLSMGKDFVVYIDREQAETCWKPPYTKIETAPTHLHGWWVKEREKATQILEENKEPLSDMHITNYGIGVGMVNTLEKMRAKILEKTGYNIATNKIERENDE